MFGSDLMFTETHTVLYEWISMRTLEGISTVSMCSNRIDSTATIKLHRYKKLRSVHIFCILRKYNDNNQVNWSSDAMRDSLSTEILHAQPKCIQVDGKFWNIFRFVAVCLNFCVLFYLFFRRWISTIPNFCVRYGVWFVDDSTIATNDKFLYIEDIFLSLNFSIVFKWRCERQMDSDTNMALL